MNSRNSETSEPYRLLLNFSDEINLKRIEEYVALSNLSTCYTWRNIKKSYNNKKIKYQLQRGTKNLNYLD